MLKKSQVKFIFYFISIFLILFILLFSLGLIPESMKNNEGDSLRTLWDKAQKQAIDDQIKQGVVVKEEPVRIVIDKIGADSAVANPSTTNVTTLDEYLKQGVVRYPGSGYLGFGNMFIFGHNADAFPNVINPAYKAFNKLGSLEVGDIIKVYGASKVYTYKVTSVRMVDKTKALVEFDNTSSKLTLSTCNTLGSPSERYVVEADYVR
jgi:LPXTG-site transpeptidase (sortase) family protein